MNALLDLLKAERKHLIKALIAEEKEKLKLAVKIKKLKKIIKEKN